MTLHFAEQSWFKSSYSGPNGGDCVETNLSLLDRYDVVAVRDSKNQAGARLVVNARSWRAFLNSVTKMGGDAG